MKDLIIGDRSAAQVRWCRCRRAGAVAGGGRCAVAAGRGSELAGAARPWGQAPRRASLFVAWVPQGDWPECKLWQFDIVANKRNG